MRRYVALALVGLLFALGCERGSDTGGTGREPRDPAARPKPEDRKPSSDSSAPEGAPGGSNRGAPPNR
jgi:hypothetical protein